MCRVYFKYPLKFISVAAKRSLQYNTKHWYIDNIPDKRLISIYIIEIEYMQQ